MDITRYNINHEFSLGNPTLYKVPKRGKIKKNFYRDNPIIVLRLYYKFIINKNVIKPITKMHEMKIWKNLPSYAPAPSLCFSILT